MGKKSDSIFIPLEKLQQGFDLCRKQMEMLLDSSEILYDTKKYPMSITMSILAREESAKLELIKNHMMIETGISKKIWDSVTRGFVHETKLIGPLKSAIHHAEQIGEDMFDMIEKIGIEQGLGPLPASYTDFMKVTDEDLKRLTSLNSIKKDCFYLDWRNSDWQIFSNLSKKQLEAIAFVELIGVRYLLYGFTMMEFKFRKNDSKSQKELKQLEEKFQKINNIRSTNKFKTKAVIAWSVYKQYFKS